MDHLYWIWYKNEREKREKLKSSYLEVAEKALNKNLLVPYEVAMMRVYETEADIKRFEKHFGGAA